MVVGSDVGSGALISENETIFLQSSQKNPCIGRISRNNKGFL
jgi:hypothetical protein